MQAAEFHKLQENIKGKTIILTVGNSLKGDDGFGPVLAGHLKDKIPSVIDGGIAPENYISSIIKESPDTILVIDAADFKGQCGEMRLFAREDMQGLGYFTTHNLPLDFMLKFLEENCKEAKIMFLGIQPKSVSFGQGLSPELEEAENCLCNFLTEVLVKE